MAAPEPGLRPPGNKLAPAGEWPPAATPLPAATQPSSYNATPAWDTSQGTVFLVLAGRTRPLPSPPPPPPPSAATNAGDAYGYAVFDVDPDARPGDTTITMKY